MRLRYFGKSLLIAALFGIFLPIFFGFIASLNMTGLGRDELPGLDNPLAVIGLIGLFISSIPALIVSFSLMLLLNQIYAIGYTIPIFSSLEPSLQATSLFVIGYASNVLIWLIPVSYIRHLKAQIASLAATRSDGNNNPQG